MGIFRTTDPTQFAQIDGIVIDEITPPSSIQGVQTNLAILIGQFERGPNALGDTLGSIGDLYEQYGNNSNFSGRLAFSNKQFGAIRIVRVTAAAAVAATLTLQYSSTNIITFAAKYTGAYGNNIQVTAAAGSTQGTKYTIHDANPGAVLPDEVYDNVLITAVGSTFSNSNLILATVVATSNEPTPAGPTNLATGSDGTVADTDYQTAIGLTEVEKSGNLVFLDAYNSVRNGYLATSMSNTEDKMAVICGQPGDSRSTAVTAAATNRSDRLIYGWPYVVTSLNGLLTTTNPASWIASVFTQTAPQVALSFTGNTGYLAGVTGLDVTGKRADFIALNAAGVCALEYDPDIGFLIKNAVTTQIANSSLTDILRRRMADFLENSIALFLKQYQNDVNAFEKRDEVKGQILAFDALLVAEKILPGTQDVKGGLPLLVDTESLNTDSVVAAGMFKILYRRRIFSSMRYIVLQADISTSVVVTDLG